MKKQVLRLGQAPTKEPKPPAPAIKILDDAAVDEASLKELRKAYRELRILHESTFKEMIGQRVGAVLQRLQDEDIKTGGHRPLGYVVGKGRKLEADAHERKIMQIAKQRRAQGMSLRKIAEHLEELGFVARNEKRFEAAQIKRLIERADTFEERS